MMMNRPKRVESPIQEWIHFDVYLLIYLHFVVSLTKGLTKIVKSVIQLDYWRKLSPHVDIESHKV